MKKLKLNLSSVQGVEFLTREQLKTISGGSSSGQPCTDTMGCPPGEHCLFGACTDMPGGSLDCEPGTYPYLCPGTMPGTMVRLCLTAPFPGCGPL